MTFLNNVNHYLKYFQKLHFGDFFSKAVSKPFNKAGSDKKWSLSLAPINHPSIKIFTIKAVPKNIP